MLPKKAPTATSDPRDTATDDSGELVGPSSAVQPVPSKISAKGVLAPPTIMTSPSGSSTAPASPRAAIMDGAGPIGCAVGEKSSTDVVGGLMSSGNPPAIRMRPSTRPTAEHDLRDCASDEAGVHAFAVTS